MNLILIFEFRSFFKKIQTAKLIFAYAFKSKTYLNKIRKNCLTIQLFVEKKYLKKDISFITFIFRFFWQFPNRKFFYNSVN